MSSTRLRQNTAHRHTSRAATNLQPTRNRESPTKRSIFASPGRAQSHQPLTIRMDLTERQMNKLTEAISHKVDDSPVKRNKAMRPKSKSPVKDDCWSDAYVLPSMAYDDKRPRPYHANNIPPISKKKLANEAPEQAIPTLAGRRNQVLPQPIETFQSSQQSRREGEMACNKARSPLETSFSSDEPIFEENERSGVSSHYGTSTQVKNEFQTEDRVQVNDAIVKMYNSWSQVNTPDLRPEYPQRRQSLAQRPRRSKSTVDQTIWPYGSSLFSVDTLPLPAPAEPVQSLTSMLSPSCQFSPLPLYFRGQSFPTVKKGEKTMIGCNGWLESTERSLDDCKKPQSKRMAFIDSIKRMAKDVTAELNSSSRRPNLASSGFTSPQLTISLNAREQSLLYCELEFHLTSSLNDYLISEFEKGHLVPDNLKKISDSWLQNGRPRVISFRYDLETQLELVALHLNEFNFYGRRQSNPAEISGLLHAMKVNARAIRIRTFCQPDSVIAKQLVDSQSLFNLLSVSHSQQLALAEIAHFFKMIVEREASGCKQPGQEHVNP